MALSTADRLDILELVARADLAASERNADAYVALFTEHAVLDGAQGAYRGRAALRQGVAPVWAAEGDRSEHLTLNAVIDASPEDDDHADVRSTLVIIESDGAPRIRAVVPIAQRVARAGEAWLIERRTVGIDDTDFPRAS